MVSADRDKLSQVVVNLLSNAVKYTPEGGKIEVDCQQEAGHSVLTVKDTGIGVNDLNLPHLFERFYRVDPSRNRGTGGAGIGLAICKAIVEAHGGQIFIESDGLDQGTTVKVVL
jgi:signal transduction histidine kinase